MLRFKVVVKSDSKVLENLIGKLKDTKAFNDSIKKYYYNTVVPNTFKTEGGYLGSKWKGLTKRTVKSRDKAKKTGFKKRMGVLKKVKFGGSHPILRQTDTLYGSLRKKANYVSTDKFFGIKVDDPIFDKHQKGMYNLPKRSILKITKKMQNHIRTRLFKKHLEK